MLGSIFNLDDMPPLQRKHSSSSSGVSSSHSSCSSDETDTLFELTDMLSENQLTPSSFTGLLFGELVPDASDLTQDDAKSDSDSGYTSPPGFGDDNSFDSWLLSSVSSTDSVITQTLPSISSIIPTSQRMRDVTLPGNTTDGIALAASNIEEISVDISQFTSNAFPAQTVPTPLMPLVSQNIKVKDEPIDICDEIFNRTQNLNTSHAALNIDLASQLKHSQYDLQSAPVKDEQFDMLSSEAMKQEAADHLFRLKFSPHVLPPCRVCGAQATGYHYGANTCEPCKGFYHRMIKREKKAECLKDGKCPITTKNRGSCPACRFQKCLDAGMGKENIKTGRYSYSKRSRDIIELQSTLKHPKRGSRSTLFDNSKQQQAFQYIVQQSTLSTSTASRLEPSIVQDLPLESDTVSQHILSTLKAAREKIVGKMLQTKFTLSKEELQRIRTFRNGEFSAPKDAAHQEFLQWLHNGFKHNFWSSYIKAIPGFKELNMLDQIAIIKRSFVEFWAVARHRLFDVENGVFYGLGGAVLQLREILDEDQQSALFNAVKRLQNLRLSVDESCVLSAFVVLNIDSDDMHDSRAVESLKHNLLTALIYALKHQRPRPLSTFSQIISALTELKGGCNKMSHFAIFPEDVTPPLFREVVLAMDR